MSSELLTLITGEILEQDCLSLAELCRATRISAEQLFELVDQGIVEPSGREPQNWSFGGGSIQRILCAQRLQQDLGVNMAGAALAIDLLEEINLLRNRLSRFESGLF